MLKRVSERLHVFVRPRTKSLSLCHSQRLLVSRPGHSHARAAACDVPSRDGGHRRCFFAHGYGLRAFVGTPHSLTRVSISQIADRVPRLETDGRAIPSFTIARLRTRAARHLTRSRSSRPPLAIPTPPPRARSTTPARP